IMRSASTTLPCCSGAVSVRVYGAAGGLAHDILLPAAAWELLDWAPGGSGFLVVDHTRDESAPDHGVLDKVGLDGQRTTLYTPPYDPNTPTYGVVAASSSPDGTQIAVLV